MQTVRGLYPAGNPPLAAKAVDRQPSPMIVLRGQKTAGSRAPMVLNYSRCVVLGSGPA